MSGSENKTIQSLNVAVLIFGILALFAALMPIVTCNGYYENIFYLKGITYLLLLTPFFIIFPAIGALYSKLPKAEVWYISVGIIGLLLTIYAVVVGANALQSFIASNSNINTINPVPDTGGGLLFVSYLGAILSGSSIQKKIKKGSQLNDKNFKTNNN